MASTVVGVDIGSRSIRAVELSGFEGAKPQVVRKHEVALPEGVVTRGEVTEVNTVATALRGLWRDGKFKSKDVVLGIGGARVFARDLSVPRLPLDRIRESLPFYVQDQLPVPVADAILDFYPISEGEGENGPTTEGLLVAAIRESVVTNVSAALEAGLRPVHVDLLPFALCRAVVPVGRGSGDVAVVEIGAESTNIVVTRDGVPQFVRVIQGGGNDVTNALGVAFQWAPDVSENTKRVIGLGRPGNDERERPVVDITRKASIDLMTSIGNTISYYGASKADARIDRIILTGGGAQLLGLAQALAEVSRLRVEAADVPALAGSEGTAGPHTYTTAFGLALGSHA